MNRVWNHGKIDESQASTEMSITSKEGRTTGTEAVGTMTPASLWIPDLVTQLSRVSLWIPEPQTHGMIGDINTGLGASGTMKSSVETDMIIRQTNDQDTRNAGKREDLKSIGAGIDGGGEARNLLETALSKVCSSY